MENKKPTFFNLLKSCLQKNISFACWQTPNSEEIHCIIQRKQEAVHYENITQKGFVFYPFQITSTNRAYIVLLDFYFTTKNIPNEVFDFVENCIPQHKNQPESKIKESTKKTYFKQINKILETLNNKEAEKIILSRILFANKIKYQELDVFRSLCSNYKHSFNYLININQVECWTGASPEPLLSVKKDNIETISLAATRKNTSNAIEWTNKEIEEQQIVTKYIEETLQAHQLNYSKSETHNFHAGNVTHLRNVFTIKKTPNINIAQLLTDLHPTPAVCGLPKQKAQKMILEIEDHDRSYYSGFLGPQNLNNESLFFVNIRCLKVLPSQFALYLGGGITPSSNPNDEWEETNAKSRTLLNIIETL